MALSDYKNGDRNAEREEQLRKQQENAKKKSSGQAKKETKAEEQEESQVSDSFDLPVIQTSEPKKRGRKPSVSGPKKHVSLTLDPETDAFIREVVLPSGKYESYNDFLTSLVDRELAEKREIYLKYAEARKAYEEMIRKIDN